MSILITSNSRISRWIDQFQQQLSIPVAKEIGKFAKVKISSIEQLLMAGKNNKLLMVVPGPFKIEYDLKHTWWHGLKVVVHSAEIASILCRLDSDGTGGFYAVKVWDLFKQEYVYHGDPSQELQLKPYWVIRIINEHLANQYHVGFVEEKDKKVLNSLLEKTPVRERDLKDWINMSRKRI